MRRGWAMFAAGLLAASTAHAGDAPPLAAANPLTDAELAQSYIPIARDAAAAGSCDLVWHLGQQVAALDPVLHARAFVADPLIAACLRARARPAAPPPSGPPRGLTFVDDDAPPAGPAGVVPRSQPAGAGLVARTGTPPLSGGRLIGEVLVGSLAAAGGGVLGAYIGEGLCTDQGEDPCIGELIRGAYLGATLGVSLGVYAVGAWGDQDGSLPATVAGSVLGGVLGLALLVADDDALGWVAVLAGPPVGALIGFNLTRRWDPAPRTALLSLRGGDLALGIPLVTRGTGATGAPVTTLTLLGGSF